jgi:Carboxypeptidase regulatory-like domain
MNACVGHALALFMILAGVAAYAGICPVTDFRGRGVIGTVCYEVGETCVPIPGAHVDLRLVSTDDSGSIATEATTDNAGAFRIECPTAGRFWIRVTANGFHAVSGRLIAKKRGKVDRRIRVILGWDMIAPCGGGYMEVDAASK